MLTLAQLISKLESLQTEIDPNAWIVTKDGYVQIENVYAAPGGIYLKAADDD
jgi:hypothetical protein